MEEISCTNAARKTNAGTSSRRAMTRNKKHDPDCKTAKGKSKGSVPIITEDVYEGYKDLDVITIDGLEYKLQYTKQLPPLTFQEFATLFYDIASRGIMVPIIIDELGNVIDGKHRLIVAHILGIKNIPFQIRPSLDDAEKRQIAQDLNLHRRHLDQDQIRDLAIQLRQEGKSYRQIGEKLGLSHETVRRELNDAVNDMTVELPEITIGKDGKQRQATTRKSPSIYVKSVSEAKDAMEACAAAGADNLPDKAIDFKRLERIARETKTEQLRQNEYQDVKNGATTLLLGDFRVRGNEIEPESVDIILTDPPYLKEFLSLWADLGQLAKRVLKPGGILLSYSGSMYLPQIYQMLGEHLQYFWTFAIYHTSSKNLIPKVNVNQAWKPILGYIKPPMNKYWNPITDMFSGGKSKEHHDWEQSLEEAKYYLQAFCPKDAVVLDPMAGSGTSILAAAQLGYKAIGIEIDPAAYATAEQRIKSIK